MDNSDKKPQELNKPHHYGEQDGINIFHAIDKSHDALIGKHIHNPNNKELEEAIKSAKGDKMACIIIHGMAPECLRGKTKDMKKTELHAPIYFDDLKKGFFQNDGSTATNVIAHAGALGSANPSLMKWGQEKLSSLPKDALEQLELDGKTFKIRKHDADLYSGWIEKDGNKLHDFVKVTLPELLLQIQSKLDLYGKEEQAVDPLIENSDALHKLIEAYFKKYNEEMPTEAPPLPLAIRLQTLKDKVDSKLNPHPFDETREDEIKEKKDFDNADKDTREKMSFDEINELEDQIKEIHEEVVPFKQIFSSMSGASDVCEDCGSSAAKCECFDSLSMPRFEFDMKAKKVTILFKSEWKQDDRESYVEDFKERIAHRIFKKFNN